MLRIYSPFYLLKKKAPSEIILTHFTRHGSKSRGCSPLVIWLKTWMKKKNQEVRKEAKMNLASWFPLRLKRLVNRQNPLSFKRRHYQLYISWLPPNSLQKHHNDLFLIISFGNRHLKWNQGDYIFCCDLGAKFVVPFLSGSPPISLK